MFENLNWRQESLRLVFFMYLSSHATGNPPLKMSVGLTITAVFYGEKLFFAVKVPHLRASHNGCDIRTYAGAFCVIVYESWLTIAGKPSPVIPTYSWSTSVGRLLTLVDVLSNTGKDTKR